MQSVCFAQGADTGLRFDENGGYESEVLLAIDLAKKDGSKIIPAGGVSGIEIFAVKIWKAFADFSVSIWKKITGVTYGFFA